MVLGKVIGTVVATRKEPSLEGLRLLLVRGLDLEGKANGALVVAVDAVVMAIVDQVEIGGEVRFQKQ